VFPYEKSMFPPPVLWANKASLMECSSYFKAMFSGDFSEKDNVLVQTSKFVDEYQGELAKVIAEERGKSQSKAMLAYESDDEDEDNDWTTASNLIWRPSVPATIHYVVVRDASYKLYEALLKWHLNKEIYFTSFNSAKDALHFGHPTVSAKAVFKLANQLDIKKLEDRAIESYEEQLNPSNVLKELFSQDCSVYPRMKRAAFRGLDRHWEEVVSTGGLDTISTFIESIDCDPKEIALTTVEILKKSIQRAEQTSKQESK
jgi:hypothetical protein